MLFADSKKKPKGDISFDENILNELELKFVKDSVNHPEHGNILGWPALDGDISNRANDLADKVTALESTEVIRYKD